MVTGPLPPNFTAAPAPEKGAPKPEGLSEGAVLKQACGEIEGV
jgi:hypothetical protein